MIVLLSLNFKNTPLKIREYFAFEIADRKKLLISLCEEEFIDEAALLITCNRTEIYISSSYEQILGKIVNIILKKCEMLIKKPLDNIRDYVYIFSNRSAIAHLYRVSAGLDSMVLGEDQILGQVKDAIEFARECDTAGLYLNTLFRDAVTEAKKIKTETLISKSGVSTATLALKLAKDVFSSFDNKKLMIIGASGKIGNIVLKNALSYNFSKIYVTRRRHRIEIVPKVQDRVSVIEYADRYKYIKEADIIISATSGPHFTITKEHISESCKGDKKVFADLALPCDIDEGISEISGVYYYNLDDMKEIARENNEKKRLGIEQAEIMVDEGVEKFLKWALFQENLDVFEKIRESLEKEVLRVGEKRAIEHMFYKIRDRGSLEALRSIIDVFSE